MNSAAKELEAAPLPLEPFEFECYGSTYQILNNTTKQKLADLWVRIDIGNPEQIGKGLKAGLFVLLMGLFGLTHWSPAEQLKEELNRIAQTARIGRVEMIAL